MKKNFCFFIGVLLMVLLSTTTAIAIGGPADPHRAEVEAFDKFVNQSDSIHAKGTIYWMWSSNIIISQIKQPSLTQTGKWTIEVADSLLEDSLYITSRQCCIQSRDASGLWSTMYLGKR